MKRSTIARAFLGLAILGTTASVVAGPAHVSAHHAASPFPALLGTWYNLNTANPNITHIAITAGIFGTYAHNYGACSPTDCDWGVRPVVGFGSDTYIFPFAIKTQSLARLGGELRAITHTHFTDGSGRPDYTSVEYFRRGPLFAAGTWVNTDAATRGITRLLLGDNGDGSYGVHSYGACVPTDCDGGSATTVATSAYADTVTYTYSFKTATYTLTNDGPYLRAAVVNHFTDGSDRDYNAVYYFQLQPVLAIGNWVNVDPNTRDITHIGIAQQPDGSLVMHGYGACSPTDCDWGTAPIALAVGEGSATYTFSFAVVSLTLTQTGTTLHATVSTHFTDGSGRADYTTSDDFTLA